MIIVTLTSINNIIFFSNHVVRMNWNDGLKDGIEQYIVTNHFSKGKLKNVEYEHWRCFARQVDLDFIAYMKSIEDNPLLDQDILSDVARLEEKVRMENKNIRG